MTRFVFEREHFDTIHLKKKKGEILYVLWTLLGKGLQDIYVSENNNKRSI